MQTISYPLELKQDFDKSMDTTQSTVFLVDDDTSMRETLASMLEHKDIPFKAYHSAESFLAGYTPEQRGCLVLDLQMPQMNGLELQANLAEQSVSLPIIFISGIGDVPQTVQALKAGAVDFLEKPFRQQTFLSCVEDAFKKDLEIWNQQQTRDSLVLKINRLTDREREVLSLLLSDSGMNSSKEIAQHLDISHRTVDHHRARSMEKTETKSMQELTRFAILAGFDEFSTK